MRYPIFLSILSILTHFSSPSQQYSISVLIFGDHFDNIKGFIERSFIEKFGSIPIILPKLSINVNMIHGGFFNKSNSQLISDTICEEVLNNSIAVIIYSSIISSNYLRLASSASLSLGFYRIPSIIIGLREAQLDKKRLYPSLLTSTPSFAGESSVFVKLLNRLNYRQVSLITIHGDKNGRRFTDRFMTHAKSNKIHIQKEIVVQPNEEYLNVSLNEHFEDITSNVILMFAIKRDAEKIFANSELFTIGKLWIVNEDASKAFNVPNGVISSKLNLDNEESFRNSLSTLKNGLNVLNGTETPPSGCEKRNDIWTYEESSIIFKSLCSSRSSNVRYDNECRRELIDYDVINIVNGTHKTVGTMNGNELELDEESILWPDGMRPFEISLPRHLRVLIVSDPPFVYSIPSPSPNHCNTLSQETVRINRYQTITIDSKWYYCSYQIGESIQSRQHYCCSGYAIDLLNRLSQPYLPNARSSHHLDTSFTFELRLVSSYGSVTASIESGYNLTGAIQLLVKQEADMAIGAISINPEREQFVDFSEPWLYHGIRIVEKAIPRSSPMQSFLQPLQSSLWISLLICVIAVGFVIYLLDINSPFKAFYNVPSEGSIFDYSNEERVGLGESMWFVWGVLLNSGVSEKTPRSGSARVLAVVWCGFCMIVIASYTANLAAFLVLDQPEKSLTGISDPRLRNPSANFSFGTVLHSNVYQYFKRHVELSTVSRKMEQHNVENVEDAINSLLSGNLDAFIWDSIRIDWESSRRCELRPRGTLFGRSAYGVALQKGSPWTTHITTALLTMAESGVMEGLDHKWIMGTRGECVSDTIKSPDRLGLSSMRDLFVLLTLAVTLGAILSVIEVSFGRHRSRTALNRKLALRYGRRWLTIMKKRRMNPKIEMERRCYNMQMIVYRRGFAGLQTATLEETWRNNLIRRKEDPSIVDRGEWKPSHDFSIHPSIIFCTRCRGLVETLVEHRPGILAYLSILIMALLFLWPCAPLPCYLPFFNDHLHICPVCSHRIARARKIGKNSFYV